MTIDNHCGQNDPMPQYPGSQAEAHAQVALEQLALYAAKLAIARWSNESSFSAALVAPSQPGLSREAWYTQAQQNFSEWLGCGGFAQYEIACSDNSDADLASPVALPAYPMTVMLGRRSGTCVD